MKERAQDDDHEHETLCASIASADEISPVRFSLCDGAELETRPKGEHEGATARQVDDILLEMKDVKSELLQVRELIGVLVRKKGVLRQGQRLRRVDWTGWNESRTSKTTKKVKPTCKKLSVTRPKP